MLVEDYGLFDDVEAAAVVGRNGAIDWLCLPRFDLGTCCSALLGGVFEQQRLCPRSRAVGARNPAGASDA